MKTHKKECAHSGRTLDEASLNFPLCICDPDGKKARAMTVALDLYRRRTVLHQDEVWYPKDGSQVRLDEMSLRWKKNLLAFLERRAEALHNSEMRSLAFGPQPSGDAASDAFDLMTAELIEMKPMTWLYRQPLVERLEQLIREEHDGPVDRFDPTKAVNA